MFYLDKNCRHGFGRLGLILVLPFIILVLAYVVYKLFFIPDPVVRGLDAFKFLPATKSVKLDCENISSLDISIYQNGRKVDLLKDSPETGEKIYEIEIKPKELGLVDGRAIVTVSAKTGILKEVQYDIETVIDTVPPVIEVVRSPSFIHRGSAGFARLRAKDADIVFIELAAPESQDRGQDKTFRAFKVAGLQSREIQEVGPESQNENNPSKKQLMEDYYVFFPAPFDIAEGSMFYAVAMDEAGNRSVKALPTKLKEKKYRVSLISIDDAFIRQVVSPLLNEINIADPEAAFKKVNEEWRQQSLDSLKDIAQRTEPEILWEGRFLQLRNSKVMATYGDKRTYIYKGKKISKSVHLGYDLASVANAPVQAANAGIVKFAGNLSIYGNTVVIDHGLGLMSLYGHLSTISVQEGQEVGKGEIIAQTGSTGLAGGDHLHFGILVHGYEVSPLYWWDQRWIKVNILDYLSP